jgi:hypothetical protein
MEVGEKVQVESAGRPEQLKVSFPVRVLEGIMKMVASLVAPCAMATTAVPVVVYPVVPVLVLLMGLQLPLRSGVKLPLL